ncbi:hypothetical protein MBLNU459_g5495t1 [Dothideomycetes sp. NU459]
MSSGEDEALSPVLLDYSKTIFEEPRFGHDHGAPDFETAVVAGQGEKPRDFNGFLRYLTSPESSAMAPSTLDLSYPISNYFVSSSHNTYLSGNQLYGRASATAYANVLERGCRCVEIDVWDGEDDQSSSDSDRDSGNSGTHVHGLRKRFRKELDLLKTHASHASTESHQSALPNTTNIETKSKVPHGRVEPRVLHGHTATKEVSFRTICETIRDHAFVHSDLPIIVSLEIHTCPEQQSIMVDIMREMWGPHLVDKEIKVGDDVELPSLQSLLRKILIKVKYSSPAAAAARHTASTSASSAGEPDLSDEDSQTTAVKKGQIIPELGLMGVFTRSCHFRGFEQPEARLPTHIFALSESKLIGLHKRNPSALFCHNKKYLMRAYPKGFRVSSSNLDPAPFWRLGVQFVALNWQHTNAAMMLNQAMFESTGGWVLKPEGYRSTAPTLQASALDRGTLNLSIEVFAGRNIGPPAKHLRLYARAELHIEDVEEEEGDDLPEGGKSKDGQIKVNTQVARGGCDPDFARQVLRFENVPGVAEELTFLRYPARSARDVRLEVWLHGSFQASAALSAAPTSTKSCGGEEQTTSGSLSDNPTLKPKNAPRIIVVGGLPEPIFVQEDFYVLDTTFSLENH